MREREILAEYDLYECKNSLQTGFSIQNYQSIKWKL